MDKELFEELEANLIRALELVRSAQTKQDSPQEQINDDKVLSRDAEYYLEQLDAIQKVLGCKRAKDFADTKQDHPPVKYCIFCKDVQMFVDGQCRKCDSADTKQINDDKPTQRSFVVRSRQSVDSDELDEQGQDSNQGGRG